MITLEPAYGRDYKGKDAALADYNANKDFILQDMDSPYDGKPINKPQVEKTYAGQRIQIRYASRKKVFTVDVPENTQDS